MKDRKPRTTSSRVRIALANTSQCVEVWTNIQSDTADQVKRDTH